MSSSTLPKTAFPKTIALPVGWQPEGITSGSGTSFYVGSLVDGAIYAGDYSTGNGSIFVPGQAGLMAMGLFVDPRTNYLFVAGGIGGQGRVYDTMTGALLRTYQFQPVIKGAYPSALINDVIVTPAAAYFTDSFNACLYRVPLEADGALPDSGAVENVLLSGDFVLTPPVPGELILNANGIEATADGSWLLIVQTTTGGLFRVDPATGGTKLIDLGGGALPIGDGLLLVGSRLYVVQKSSSVAVVHLNQNLTAGVIERVIEDPAFRVPATVASYGDSLYVVNARFGVANPEQADYDVVQVPMN